jgi:CheY-like chemotaxis protein
MAGDEPRPLILVLEEETHERTAIAEHLEQAGFAVLEAEDSDRALACLESRSDLRGFVTDAHVPGSTDGFELARIVRERWPGLAVVMMSGHSDASSGPVPDGAEFVTKPYVFSHLAPALRRLLNANKR